MARTLWRERRPYPAAIACLMDDWDGGDVYGSARAIGFALADVAGATDVASEVWSALKYSPGMCESWDLDDLLDEDSGASGSAHDLAHAYSAGDVTDDDLIHAARVISRYLDLCKLAGLDY